jgi:hypothetical protein
MENRQSILGPLLLAVLALELSCSGVPPLRPYDARTNSEYRLAPLVVVGLAEGDELIGRPVRNPTNPDESNSLHLHRVAVRVENVLKGAVPEHMIAVYYFAFERLNVGTRILSFGREPVRRVLWLRKDAGVYRTACDAQNCTVWIESGAHPGYTPDPNASLDQTLVDFSLTRGEGPVNDYHWAKEIGLAVERPGLDGYTIEKLRHLALTESSDVKYTACQWLWSYSHWEIGDRLREVAHDSVTAAGCTCQAERSGLYVCR